jgi:HAD superfamily hydrolase (TIGR01509 family)
MVKGILFDAAGVLYHRPQPTGEFVAARVRDMGLPGQLSAQDRARQKALKSQGSRGLLSPEAYWDQVLQMYGVDNPAERRALVAAVDRHADDVWPMPGCQAALAGLKQRGMVLCIVTDTMHTLERKMRWLERAGVARWIDVVACSTVVGVHKPEPGIYLDALRQATLSPEEAAFVGHSAVELEGARRIGLASVAVYHDPGARADYYAASLIDLLNVPIFRRDNERGMSG